MYAPNLIAFGSLALTSFVCSAAGVGPTPMRTPSQVSISFVALVSSLTSACPYESGRVQDKSPVDFSDILASLEFVIFISAFVAPNAQRYLLISSRANCGTRLQKTPAVCAGERAPHTHTDRPTRTCACAEADQDTALMNSMLSFTVGAEFAQGLSTAKSLESET